MLSIVLSPPHPKCHLFVQMQMPHTVSSWTQLFLSLIGTEKPKGTWHKYRLLLSNRAEVSAQICSILFNVFMSYLDFLWFLWICIWSAFKYLSSCSNLPCDDALVPSIRIQWCSNFGLTRQKATNAKLLVTIGNRHLRSLSVKIQRPMLK